MRTEIEHKCCCGAKIKISYENPSLPRDLEHELNEWKAKHSACDPYIEEDEASDD